MMAFHVEIHIVGGEASVPKVSLSKTIEATKLNKRTGFAESGPDVTIPFGGLVEHVATERDSVRFTYMGDLYRCSEDLWNAAIRDSLASGGAKASVADEAPPPAAAPGVAAVAPGLIWETLNSPRIPVHRTKVPGGWLLAGNSGALVFFPDPEHQWDGKSL